MQDFQQVEYMAWPRGIALAEVGWSKAEHKNFSDFSRRLGHSLARLSMSGVNFFKQRELKQTRPAIIETTMGTLNDKYPVCAFDGDVNSEFVSEHAVKNGDSFTVMLANTARARNVTVKFHPLKLQLRSGRLEVTTDGRNWKAVASGEGTELTATVNGAVKGVRLVIDKDSDYQLAIREFIIR